MLHKKLAVALCLGCAIALVAGGLAGAAEPVETYGNNLSVPTVFAEGYGVTGFPIDVDNGLRGDPADPQFIEPHMWDGTQYYLQRTVNTWQAATESGKSEGWSGPVGVTVDWSDNLQARSWRTDSVIRIEHVLTTLGDSPANAYVMQYLYGEGIGEVWGTDSSTYGTMDRCVYTVCARLRIERVVDRGGEPTGTPIYDSAIYERFGVDGPSDAYSAEINVSGKLIYGTMWHLDTLEMTDIGLPADYPKTGWYRITYTLDPSASYVIAGEEGAPVVEVDSEPCNVRMTSLHESELGLTESAPSAEKTPLLQLDEDGMWTSLDIYVARSSGGGGGGGKPGRAIR